MAQQEARLIVTVDPSKAKAGIDSLDKTMRDFTRKAKAYFESIDAQLKFMGGLALQTANKIFRGYVDVARTAMKNIAGIISNSAAWTLAVKAARKGMAALGKVVRAGGRALKKALMWPFEQMAKGVKRTLGGVLKTVQGMSKSLAAQLGGALIGFSSGNVLKETQVELDKFEAVMHLTAKTTEEADTVWNSLMNTGEAYGVVLKENIGDFTKFNAILSRSNVGMGEIQTMFSQLSQVSSVYHLSATDTNLAILALTQMVSKGKVSMEELRRQLAERLPGAVQVAARAFGMTAAELGKMIEEGFVDPVEMIRGLLQQFAFETQRAAAVASQSLLAELGRIENAFLDLQKALLEGGLNNAMKDMAKYLSDLLSAMANSDAVKRLAAHISELSTQFINFVSLDPDTVIAMLEALGTSLLRFTQAVAMSIRTLIEGISLIGLTANKWLTIFNGDEFSAKAKEELESLKATFKASADEVAALFSEAFAKGVDFSDLIGNAINKGVAVYRPTKEMAVGVESLVSSLQAHKDSKGKFSAEGALAQSGEIATTLARVKAQEDQAYRTIKMLSDQMLEAEGQDVATQMGLRVNQTYSDLERLQAAAKQLSKIRDDLKLNITEYGGKASDLAGTSTGTPTGGGKAPHDAQAGAMAQLQYYDKLMAAKVADAKSTREQIASIGLHGDALLEHNKKLTEQAEITKLQNDLDTGRIDSDMYEELVLVTKAQSDLNMQLQKGLVAQMKLEAAAQEWRDLWAGAADSFADMMLSMEHNFEQFAATLIREIMKLYVTQKLIEPLLGQIFDGTSPTARGAGSSKPVITQPAGGLDAGSYINPGTYVAKGGVFSGGIRPFANGGVVGSPTLFRFASGAGVMGEAGPEGILPLKRTKSGDLGVQTTGGQKNATVVNINVENRTENTQVEIEETDSPMGGKDIKIMMSNIEAHLSNRVATRRGPLFSTLQQGGFSGKLR